ncbi:MAG TPA: MFS transporter [Candidatus Saccharimonadales bacterium]
MTALQKLVLWISILASFVAFLDGSVVNVALPSMVDDLGGGLSAQQWIVDAYLISLGALMLLAGSLSDIFGRKRILLFGLLGFGAASLLCAAAPNVVLLILARGLQGAAGALLVPSSLALIMSTFSPSQSGKAVGIWTAWTGTAIIAGPVLGGLLVDLYSWRLIFAINIIPIALTTVLLSKMKAPADTDHGRVDVIGAILCTIGLGAPVYALIEQPHHSWSSPAILGPLILGVFVLGLFLRHEKRTAQPMLPLGLFRARNFSVGNIATLTIYGGLAVASFLITVFVQQVGGYSATTAGLTLVPVTIIMFLLSTRFGSLADKLGPRFFMSVGPMVSGVGFLLMLGVDHAIDYWTQLFPGVMLFGVGLAMTVAPLTSTVLGCIESSHAGIASAVNNATSRIAGLIAVAFIGVVTGTHLDVAGFRKGIILTASLLFIGGIISAIGIQNIPPPIRGPSLPKH